jgi:DNA-binding MurR/RpiR family transcriptional regulator
MNHTEGGFFDRLAARRARLSPKMLRVAHFMEANYLEGAFMSTRELADAADVSLATVVRFPRALGYTDFNTLREAIQTQVNIDLTGVERLKTLPQQNTSPGALLHRVIEEDIETLRVLAHDFSESQAEQFVTELAEAHHVTVLGFRYVGPLALYCSYSLNKIRGGIDAYTRADSSLYDHIRLLGENDLIVAIGFARYPADLVNMLQYAHGLGRHIVCITDSTLSPLVPLAEVSLFAKGTIRDFVGSLSAPGALINCLVSELGRRLGDTALARLADAEQAAQANGIYVDGVDHFRANPGWRGSLLHEAESLETDYSSM